VGPRTGLDSVEKIKFLTLLGLELHLSVIQPVASHYTDYAIPAPYILTYGAKMCAWTKVDISIEMAAEITFLRRKKNTNRYNKKRKY
jgi:hypothetical protein